MDADLEALEFKKRVEPWYIVLPPNDRFAIRIRFRAIEILARSDGLLYPRFSRTMEVIHRDEKLPVPSPELGLKGGISKHPIITELPNEYANEYETTDEPSRKLRCEPYVLNVEEHPGKTPNEPNFTLQIGWHTWQWR